MERVMMATKKKDALDRLIDKFVSDNPSHREMLDQEIVNAEAAQLVYDLRKNAGLSQRELAKKVGTTASVICRMEQADYEGSLPMLRRIAGALNRRLELRAIPVKAAPSKRRTPTAPRAAGRTRTSTPSPRPSHPQSPTR
jgi:transcriptional regulator with XRE-family HTH domain